MRRRLTPLLYNLALAILVRAAVASTFAESGERYRYYSMSVFFPIQSCPSFHCFRILPPLITSLLPLSTPVAFAVTGFVLQVLAGTMLWYIAEHLHGSRRVAALATAWFWVTWGPIQSFNDPLLITDPVQAFWSLTALYLLLTGHDGLALPVLVSGAAVKESVLLVPCVYALYTMLAKDEARRRTIWLAILVGVPIIAWLLLRLVLTSQYGYASYEDESYLRRTYFFGYWLPNLSTWWPRNLLIAALYIFGACGAAWILGAAGLMRSNRRQRALTLASLPAMVVLALVQVPDRALASFPYAVLIPAAVWVMPLPAPLTVAILLVNGAFTIRMNTAAAWIPSTPIVLAVLVCLIGVALWLGREETAVARAFQARVGGPERAALREMRFLHRLFRAAGGDPDMAGVPNWKTGSRDAIAWTSAALVFALIVAVAAVQGVRAMRSTTTRWDPADAASAANPVIPVIDDADTPALTLSPDGQSIVFVGAPGRAVPSTRQLWRRGIGAAQAEPLAGTEGASAPFWSPDGRAIGFFAGGRLRTLDLGRGAIADIADAPVARGGAWSAHDVIVFAPEATGGLYAVPARGGHVTPVTTPDGSAGDRSHRWPAFLPDADHFLFVARGQRVESARLWIGDLSSHRRVASQAEMGNAAYAMPDALVIARRDGLWVQPFDVTTLQLRGERVRLGDLAYSASSSRGAYAVSGGVLAVVPDPSAQHSGITIVRRWRRSGPSPKW